MKEGLLGDRLGVSSRSEHEEARSYVHAGLDLSRRRLDVCLVDDAGELVEHSAAPPDGDELAHLAARLRGERVRAVIESMTGARFIRDPLEELGWEVVADAVICDHPAAGYAGAMLLRPLRRAPMMLGGVGFQAGVDKARRERIEAQRQAAVRAAQAPAPAPDVVGQLKELKALHDHGALSPEEFQMAKRKLLAG